MRRTDLTVCSTGIRRTEGNHVIPFGFVHANVSAHLLSFPEGSEELGLAPAVATTDDGRVGEAHGCEAYDVLLLKIARDPHRVACLGRTTQ